jgi:hypothetical protein
VIAIFRIKLLGISCKKIRMLHVAQVENMIRTSSLILKPLRIEKLICRLHFVSFLIILLFYRQFISHVVTWICLLFSTSIIFVLQLWWIIMCYNLNFRLSKKICTLKILNTQISNPGPAPARETWRFCPSLISMKFTMWTPWIPILWWPGVCKWHIFICL